MDFVCAAFFCSSATAQFETRASYPLGPLSGSPLPVSLAVGDFNNDGMLDVATANYLPSGSVNILLGNGDGTFRAGPVYAVAVQPFSIAAADLRHKGVLDLVVGDSLTNDVYVMLGKGDGTFQAAVPYPTSGNSYAVSTGDFNGDGTLDIIALAASADVCNCIEVLPGNGDGTFGQAIITPLPYGSSSFAFATGYFNQGGKLDVAVPGISASAEVSILLGNGDGTFTPDGFYPVLSEPESVVVGDFNGDNNADLAVGNLYEGISVLLGKGDGTFRKAVNHRSPAPISVIAVDLDGDGKLDLAAADVSEGAGSAGVNVLKGNGDGTFQPRVFYPAGVDIVSVAAGDFNGDHQPDLVVAENRYGEIITLLNTGVTSFSPTTPIRFPAQLLNTTSAAQSVTLTNTGAAALTISSVTVRAPFSSTNTCGKSLAVGASCDFSVTLKPTAMGAANGLLNIVDSASSKPQVIELIGAGTVVELTPPTLNFPNQKVDTQSPPMTLTVTNTANTALTFTKISLGHEDVQAFTESNDCRVKLGPGASCTLTITFRPAKAGAHHGIVNLVDNGGGGEQIVNLFGTAD